VSAGVALLVGLGLLLLGRRLFWLFAGGAGFLAGLTVAARTLRDRPDWVILAVALLAGVAGAVLGLLLPRIAVGIAGFVAGGATVSGLLARLGLGDLAWLGVLVGGIAGAVLVIVLLDWALIALSSLMGATMIVGAVPLSTTVAHLVFLVLVVVGVLLQARQLERPR
jgi:hypothetical protein